MASSVSALFPVNQLFGGQPDSASVKGIFFLPLSGYYCEN